jgi:diguanylate cyclase (GGDEF)-like protein
MLDLDHFKAVNDTHGHLVGDEVLIECADTIARRCRHKGKVYRFGGEEIAVLLPNFTVSEAVALAESIRSEIEAGTMSSKKLSITVSIGVATAPIHATDGK